MHEYEESDAELTPVPKVDANKKKVKALNPDRFVQMPKTVLEGREMLP